MKYLKIKNFVNANGEADYKGFNIKSFVPNSQYFLEEMTYCVIATYENVISHNDVTVLTEEEYLRECDTIKEKNSRSSKTLQDEVDELKQQNAQLILALVESGVL